MRFRHGPSSRQTISYTLYPVAYTNHESNRCISNACGRSFSRVMFGSLVSSYIFSNHIFAFLSKTKSELFCQSPIFSCAKVCNACSYENAEYFREIGWCLRRCGLLRFSLNLERMVPLCSDVATDFSTREEVSICGLGVGAARLLDVTSFDSLHSTHCPRVEGARQNQHKSHR
jgi:hypothetical protein